MRLIDADRLRENIMEQELWNVPDLVYDSIRNAPTIKAVPVEYIYRRATEFSKMYTDKDTFTAKEIGLALVLIARDWEVENDKNI